MASTSKQELLRKLPSIDKLLSGETVGGWLEEHPRKLVTDCLRDAADEIRRQIVDDEGERCDPAHATEQFVLEEARKRLEERTTPHLRGAINATGIILHTGLGRAVLPECVVDSMIDEMKEYSTLAIDRRTGERSERDRRVEYILTELTGAEAATVVNNNAAATMIVLAALGGGREAIVSRGQLIEIGGSFRLPDVMSLSGARLVEVGTTNRTHLRDYANAIGDNTALIMRVHPSNFRVVGFTKEVPLEEMVALAHERGLIVVDDLGSGALVDLERFGLPHEQTVGESIAAGSDVALFSTDKLIGSAQGGAIVGKRDCIERIRRHPLARAMRVDKTCLTALERTLHLFRDPDRLALEHPLYRTLAASPDDLRTRAAAIASAAGEAAPNAHLDVVEGVGYLGSGSLPTEQLPTFLVSLTVEGASAAELGERLRMDEACIFTRIEDGRVLFDARTLRDSQVPTVAAAIGRIAR